MATQQSPDAAPAPVETKVIELSVFWERPGVPPNATIDMSQPSAQEVAAILLGLEQAYQALASALGYPPHFSKIVGVRNPTLKFDLKGGKEVIEAVEQLLFALPRFVASLFRPRSVIGLADLETNAQRERFKTEAAVAMADAAEADRRRALAELETKRIRQELEMMPLRPDPAAHALLGELVRQIRASDPTRRGGLIGETVLYLAQTQEYQPKSQVALFANPAPREGSPTVAYVASSVGSSPEAGFSPQP
jgi:hypothetical protein